MQTTYNKHPDTLFEMSGIGDESDDIWKLYVQNGKSQNCPGQIVYDEYDPAKMQ